MNFGRIDQYILFGGGHLLCLVAEQLTKDSLSVFIVTSERHYNELVMVNDVSIPFSELLKKSQVEYIVCKDVSNEYSVINKITDSTIGLSFGAAWIFRKHFIEQFNGRLLNCHGARLPQERGAGGFSWRIMRNERVGASLIHQIDEGIDTGKILIFEEYIYPHSCRCPIDFQAYTLNKYQKLLSDFFTLVKNEHSFECLAQQEYFSSCWPRLATDIHGYVDWGWSLKDIENFICAFDEPYSGASTFVNEKRLYLKKCYSSVSDGIFHPFQKGIIYRISGETVFVATENGTLLVNGVYDENGADVKQELKIGERFYTPMKHLEEAKQFRAIYTSTGLKRNSSSSD